MNNYVAKVANLFLHRRGSTLQLSPLDWQMISEWERKGVPLQIVCRVIDDIFDKIQMKPKHLRPNIKTIAYCAEEIEIAFETWCELQVGKI